MLDKLKSLLQDPPPSMAFEISEAGIAAARIGARAEMEWRPLKSGTLAVSPLKENVVDSDEFSMVVRTLAGTQTARRRKDVALILPDFSARISVLDFDSFPADAKEQAALVRFRLKRSVPFDVESAAVSYWAQSGANKRVDVVVVMAPLEIVSRYEAPFRAVGMIPGLVTTSSVAALELAPEVGLNVMAKLSGHVLTVLVRQKGALKLARCLELPSTDLADVAAVLLPTFAVVARRPRKRNGASRKNWAWRWNRCGRRSERPERITRGCWDICGPSPRTINMRIPINLASQPFRRDRAMVVASIAVSLLLAGTLSVLISLAKADNLQLTDVRHEVSRLNDQIRRATAAQTQLDAVLRRPQNAEAVEQSVFLNTLLKRKGISWTRIFADLEKVVPYNVRVIQIRPSVNAQDQVSLDMMVGSDTEPPVIELFKALQGNALFSYSDVKILQPPTEADKFYKCRVSVDYAQKL